MKQGGLSIRRGGVRSQWGSSSDERQRGLEFTSNSTKRRGVLASHETHRLDQGGVTRGEYSILRREEKLDLTGAASANCLKKGIG